MAQKADSLAATRGASYTAPSTDAVMRSGVDVSNLTLGGSPIAAAVRALRWSIKNNLKPTDQLNSEVPSGFTFGNFEVTGSAEVYFPDATIHDLIQAQNSLALSAKIANAAGAFTFSLPAVRLTGGTPSIRGQGQDVLLEIPFIAHKGTHSGTPCTIAVNVDPAGS
jgi:hypothetical protein